jgi:hypothetical protein
MQSELSSSKFIDELGYLFYDGKVANILDEVIHHRYERRSYSCRPIAPSKNGTNCFPMLPPCWIACSITPLSWSSKGRDTGLEKQARSGGRPAEKMKQTLPDSSTEFIHKLSLYIWSCQKRRYVEPGLLLGSAKVVATTRGTAFVANPLTGLLPTGHRRTASPLSDTYPEYVRHKNETLCRREVHSNGEGFHTPDRVQKTTGWMIESTLRGRGNLSPAAQ